MRLNEQSKGPSEHIHDEKIFDTGSFPWLIPFISIIQANVNVYLEKTRRFPRSIPVLTLLTNPLMYSLLFWLKNRVINKCLENQ